MNRLAFEGSSQWCSVALEAGGTVRSRHELCQRGHAERLLPWAEALLAEAGLSYGQLDALVVSAGPGSLTSVRIGMGMMQGIALAHGLPIHAVSALDAVAEAYDPEGRHAALSVIMDARMGEVYVAHYRRAASGDRLCVAAPSVCTPQDCVWPEGAEHWCLIGSGVMAHQSLWQAQLGHRLLGMDGTAAPTAEALLRLASKTPAVSAAELEPVYLRTAVTA